MGGVGAEKEGSGRRRKASGEEEIGLLGSFWEPAVDRCRER